MNYFLNFLLAASLTALSYFLGSYFLADGLKIWQAFVIGFSVVSLGAATEALGAPIWLVIFVPFPVGMVLLFQFLHESLFIWFFTYLLTLALYSLIHLLMSYFFRFHSLIPAWKLS